jgi:predicted ArsR family transcriptional regulator
MTVPQRGAVGLLDSPVRRRIVDLLAELAAGERVPDGLTAAELGDRLGVHPTTARFHLDQLVGGGLVEAHFVRARVGRPRKLYRSPTRPLPVDGSAAMQNLTSLLAETWPGAGSEAPTPEQAGRQWALRHVAPPEGATQARSPGAWLGKIGLTVDALQEWGYRPDLRTEAGGRTAELILTDCPFMTLAQARPDVVCGVHRGLIRGALEALSEPDADVGLRPFVQPRMCLATITTRAEFVQGRRIEE